MNESSSHEQEPSYVTLIAGFLIFSGVGLFFTWLLTTELQHLINSINTKSISFEFEKMSLLGFGVVISSASFATIVGKQLIKSPLTRKQQELAFKGVLLGLIIMVVGRVIGGYFVDQFIIQSEYYECQELAKANSRHRTEVWVSDPSFCTTLSPESQK
ncbi:MAG: hypothetical protein MI864_27935 [Pseudomonadales bacterium]|nr:hypothetical protein [Pseudomonadales bacterium]